MKPCWAIRVLAGPLRDSSTGEVLGMLKIERIDFQDMTLDTLGVFQGVCDWIGMVIANQRHIEELDRRGFSAKAAACSHRRLMAGWLISWAPLASA